MIFENTHEAIVDPETWELVQSLRKTVRRTDTLGEANPLTGLMFCAQCGAKMYNHRTLKKDGSGAFDTVYDHYDCGVYKRTKPRETVVCTSHFIRTKTVRALLLDTLRYVCTYAITNREAFIERVRTLSEIRHREAAKELRKKISKAKKRSAELDVLIKKLYEPYAMGKLPEKRQRESKKNREKYLRRKARKEKQEVTADRVEQRMGTTEPGEAERVV